MIKGSRRCPLFPPFTCAACNVHYINGFMEYTYNVYHLIKQFFINKTKFKFFTIVWSFLKNSA